MPDEGLAVTEPGAAIVPTRTVVLTRAVVMNDLPRYTDRTTALVVEVATHGAAKTLLTEIRAHRKQAEQHHADQKKPINAFRDRALALEKEDVSAWKKIEDGLAAKLLAFETAIEQERKAEQARLQREALAEAKRVQDEQAKLLRTAAKQVEDEATRKALNKQARAVAATPVYAAPVTVAPAVESSRTRTTWSADVLDVEALVIAVAATILVKRFPPTGAPSAISTYLGLIAQETPVPLSALEPDKLADTHPWLNGQAVQLRGELRIPGVVAVERTKL